MKKAATAKIGAALALFFVPALFGLGGCANVNKAQGAKSEGGELQAMYEVEIEELYIRDGEKEIYGKLYRPKTPAEEKMPLVIFSHGYNGTHMRALPYVAVLAERGYAAFCFDFCGGGPESRSTGSTLDMNILTEQADLEAVLAEMQKLPFVDSDNIFLMGASQGGVISAITGAVHQDEIRGMVLLYPGFVMVDDARKLFESADDIPDSYFFLGMTVGKTYYEVLLDYDMYAAIAPYKGNVLIIHGDADTIVPISYSERALGVYASAELKVVPGAGHGFSDEEAYQALPWVLEYLEKEMARH